MAAVAGAPIVPVDVNGKTVMWNQATDRNPATVGNNQSRTGFIHNPYFSAMGRFFQNTIKKGIWSVIHRIHDKEILRYDETAYTYDDPRLQNLDRIIKAAICQHINDNDFARKQKLATDVVDIVLFLCKEDIFYRRSLLKICQDLGDAVQARPDLFELTSMEQYNYDRFRRENYGNNPQPILNVTHQNWQIAKAIRESLRPDLTNCLGRL